MADTPGTTRTLVVTDAVCWFPGCRWHATGTDMTRVHDVVEGHMHGSRREVEMFSAPLTARMDHTVDFHSCCEFDKDRPANSGGACTTTDRSAA